MQSESLKQTLHPEFQFRLLLGRELEPYLESLGELRIAVFREFPYLYEGNLDYEKSYLEVYLNSDRSLVVLAETKEGIPIGATTCIPLIDEAAAFQDPFLKRGDAVEEIFYLGESIILPEFRGRGLGHLFFKFREDHCASLGGFRMTTFCAVDRDEHDPRRPSGYRPLHEFWQRQGYAKQSDLQCQLGWKEVGSIDETLQNLTFWTKSW